MKIEEAIRIFDIVCVLFRLYQSTNLATKQLGNMWPGPHIKNNLLIVFSKWKTNANGYEAITVFQSNNIQPHS